MQERVANDCLTESLSLLEGDEILLLFVCVLANFYERNWLLYIRCGTKKMKVSVCV